MTAKFPLLDQLTADPLDPNKVLAVATYFGAVNEWGVAYHLLERASQIAHHPEILRQLGISLIYLTAYAGDEKFLAASESVLLRGLELDPRNPGLQHALAVAAVNQGRYAEAENLARMSLAAGHLEAEATLGLACLYLGRWGEGFDLYEKNIDKPPFTRVLPKNVVAPYWDGKRGTKLLVVGEQGIGDEISFASMVEDASRDNEVTLWCDVRLQGLFKRSMPYCTVDAARVQPASGPQIFTVGSETNAMGFEARCLSASLGRHYRRAASNFPRKGFLTASEILRAQARAMLDRLPGRKIGIAWTGGKAPSFWHRRRLPMEDLRALTATKDITWISLQYDQPDIGALQSCGIHHFPEWTQQHDYDYTAALVMELDAVVTVPTAVAHLCGALGRPAHVLVNEKPRWFYGVEGHDHPWYEALKLHRQVGGRWPIAELKAELHAEDC
jgi:tetratricopeptide (TPR) repeat protein